MSKILKQLDEQLTEDQRKQQAVIKYLVEGATTTTERQVMVESVMGLLGNIVYAIDKIATVASKNVAARQQMDVSGELNITAIAPLSAIADAAVLAATLSSANIDKIPDYKQKAIHLYNQIENKNPSDKSLTMLQRMVELAKRINPNVVNLQNQWQQVLQTALESLQKGDMAQYVQTLQKVKAALVKLRQTSSQAVQNVPVMSKPTNDTGVSFQ